MTNVLVIGGLSCIASALVAHLCQLRNDKVDALDSGLSKSLAPLSITVIEKTPLDIASLPASYIEKLKTVKYIVGNWNRPELLEEVMKRQDGQAWDYVFNCATECRFGQNDHAYKRDILDLAVNIANIAGKNNVGVLIHLSTARVYNTSNTKRKSAISNAESSPCFDATEAPNSYIKYYVLAEERLSEISEANPSLSIVVIRPALPYGPVDRYYVAPLLMMGQVCHSKKENMKVLWERGLPVNTVHVEDIARAMVATAKWQRDQVGITEPISKATLVKFNVADLGNTTNEKIAEAVSKAFGIKKSFHDAIINAVAKRMHTQDLTDEVNESFLGPWMELLANSNIPDSPLTPYLDQEHPYCALGAHPFGVDGSLITKTPGLEFAYKHPNLEYQVLKALVNEMITLRLWPDTQSKG
ncbi:hypothetical protein H4219_003608 [Mycoemilia scoparia]|uniref:NAD-dependent epimerase/dehydratase domain-containing protein n=1 Tax=Mycoemilia scoparia TaxID=417184 RepID=A0A9W8A0R9_9FUNG|nr:hypothetical protein H4219_003608 [Mycoemilia scoparia]